MNAVIEQRKVLRNRRFESTFDIKRRKAVVLATAENPGKRWTALRYACMKAKRWAQGESGCGKSTFARAIIGLVARQTVKSPAGKKICWA